MRITLEISKLEFCPTCDSRLVKKTKKESKESMLICPKCDYKKNIDLTNLNSNLVKPESKDPIVIIGKKEQKIRTLPTVRTECPKCENNLAYVWQVQTRGADESSTQFFRCTKCGYTFREYS